MRGNNHNIWWSPTLNPEARKTKGMEFQRFDWQDAYAAFSIGQSGLDATKLYRYAL